MYSSLYTGLGHTFKSLVSCGQTLFRTEGKGLGRGHRATVTQEFSDFDFNCVPARDSRHFSLSVFSRFKFVLYSNRNFEFSR